jgi:hypothetical protein
MREFAGVDRLPGDSSREELAARYRNHAVKDPGDLTFDELFTTVGSPPSTSGRDRGRDHGGVERCARDVFDVTWQEGHVHLSPWFITNDHARVTSEQVQLDVAVSVDVRRSQRPSHHPGTERVLAAASSTGGW